MFRSGDKEKKKRRDVSRTVEKIGATSKVPATGKQRRGFKAEERTSKVLKYWQKKKLIVAFRQTEVFGWEDMEKIDFVLTLLNGKEVPVQVKNYCNIAVVEECRAAKVFLYFIGQDEDDDVAKDRMRDLIFSIYMSTCKLEPFELHQLILKTLEMKNLPQLSKWQGFKRFFSFGKVAF